MHSDMLTKMNSQRDNIELVLKNNAREKSDLQTQNMKQLNRIDQLQKKVEEFQRSIESLCSISLCLVEAQSMQIRAEEQDEADKLSIALNGQSMPDQSEVLYKAGGKYPEFPEKVGTQLTKSSDLPRPTLLPEVRDSGIELPQHFKQLKS